MKVDICFSPALYPYYKGNEDKIVVVTDIFRASTTMCAAFANGVNSILPVASIEEAEVYKNKGYKVGAERNVKRCDFADFGNSPFDYIREKVEGETIVFTTTNGTKAIEMAANSSQLLVGAFSNIQAVADYCISQQKDVLILCAGWNNQFNIEDTLFGGALADILLSEGGYEQSSDAVTIAVAMWNDAKSDVVKYIQQTEHIKRLIANGLENSAEYCLTLNTVPLVPIYDKATKKLSLVK